MNILFLYRSYINPSKGGVQRVTNVLSDYFESQNHNVYFLGLFMNSGGDYYNDRQIILPETDKFYTKKNILFFQNLIISHKIDFVVNQGGLDKDCSNLANNSNEFGAKEVSVLHNSPLSSIFNFSTSKKGRFKKINLDFLLPITDNRFVKRILLWLYKLKYKSHFEKLCKYSDSVVLLSDMYKDELRFFLSNDLYNDKIIGISNPCSFVHNKNVQQTHKEKTLLFVGRISFGQKRVDMLINIWNRLYQKFPDWKLEIVGFGPDLDKLKEIASDLGVERVYFDGFQNPEHYYQKASIFCMTSSYEGFPMVLAEAQVHGTVPVAFNSFASVTDIIEDGKTGFLVEPFNEIEYSNTLSKLMSDKDKLQSISENCIESSKKFSIEQIGGQWLTLFRSLKSVNND